MKVAGEIIGRQDRDGMLRRSLERIIQLYTDKSHFVYELLQNAEDAGATSIKFIQYADRLEVFHDGRAFTIENLQGLCDIGKSDKIGDLNQIGEFGVGFKSVFGICEKVMLYSSPTEDMLAENCHPFSVEIQDFTKPVDIEDEPIPGEYTTRFVFPYAVGQTFSGFASIDKLNEKVSERLKNLGVNTLLFMRNLQLIEYEIKIPGEEAQGSYRLNKEIINDHCTVASMPESENDKGEGPISFLKFTKPIDNGVSHRTIDIAFTFAINKYGAYNFKKAKDPFISVYFPTETESKLHFIVQGPFRTTPNRSSVPADDDENKHLAQQTAQLLCESILEMREMGYLNLSILKVLPIDRDAFYAYELFKPLYDGVRKLISEEEVLPTRNGGFVSADEALIARGQDLPEVFTDEKISELMWNRVDYKWLPTNITETSQYKDAFYYLRDDIGIKVIRPEDLKDYLNTNKKFLPSQSDEWLIKMYKLYETIPNVFQEKSGNILDAMIVKTAKGKFVAPYRKSGGAYLPNVFLPSDEVSSDDVDMVDEGIYSQCKSFFEKVLHLTKPNQYEYFVKNLKKRYQSLEGLDRLDADRYVFDLRFLILYGLNPEYSSEVETLICEFFAIKTRTGWVRPFSEVVLFPQTESGLNLEAYYKNISDDVFFVDYEWYQARGIGYKELSTFGVSDSILENENLTWGRCYFPEPGSYFDRSREWRGSDEFRWKLTINKIEAALCYISNNPRAKDSKIKSNTIFRLLQENEEKLVGTVWVRGHSDLNKYDEPASIIRILRNEQEYNYALSDWNGKWLYTESGELVSQGQISKRDLNTALYGKVKLDSDLYDLLGFKKNKVDQIESAVKEYDQLPDEKKESYFAIELERRFGISIEDLNQTYGNRFGHDSGGGFSAYYDDDDEFEFPTSNVKNWDALKKHAAQVLCYANPVKYEYVVRSIRTSRPQDDVRAYLMNMYRVGGTYKYACQLCHEPHSSVEMCQLEPNPDVELDPLNLCLCRGCAAEFRKLRNNEYLIGELIDEIMNLDEDEIGEQDPVSINIEDQDFWFTQTHIAEIKELMLLKKEAKRGKYSSGSVATPRTGSGEPGTDTPDDDPLQNGLNVYFDYVGKRVLHKKNNEKATVTACDGKYIVLKFDSDTSDGEGKKFSLKTCLENGVIEILDE